MFVLQLLVTLLAFWRADRFVFQHDFCMWCAWSGLLLDASASPPVVLGKQLQLHNLGYKMQLHSLLRELVLERLSSGLAVAAC